MSISATANRSVRWTASLAVFLAVIGVLQISLLARYLSPQDFGTMAIIAVIIGIADVFVRVGFSDVIIANQEISSRQLSTLYWLNIVTAVVVYLLVSVFAYFVVDASEVEGISTMVQVTATTLLLGSFGLQFEALARKGLHFRLLTFVGVLQSVSGFGVAVFFAVNGYGVWSLIYSVITAQGVKSLLLFIFAWRMSWLPSAKIVIFEVLDLVKFGFYRIGASLLNNVNSRIDQIAIFTFLGPFELGIYSVAHSIAMKPFQQINPILTRVSFPIFSRISSDPILSLAAYRKALRLLMLINAPILVGYISIAHLVIPLLLGESWLPAVAVSQLLAVYVLFRSAANINVGLILGFGKYRWPFYWNLLLVFIVPLVILFVSATTASLLAVSISLVIIQAVLLVLGYFVFARALLGRFGLGFATDILRSLCAALLMMLGVMLIDGHLENDFPLVDLSVLISSGAFIYLLASIVLQRKAILELRSVVLDRR